MSDSLLTEATDGGTSEEGQAKGSETQDGKQEVSKSSLLESKPGWLLSMPKEYQDDEELAQYGRVGDFLRAHKQLKSQIQPIPEGASAYEFSADDIPQGMRRDPEYEVRVRELAVKAKLTNDQAREIYRDQLQYAAQQMGVYENGRTKAKDEAVASLKSSLGEDGFKSAGARVSRVLTRYDQSDGELLRKLSAAGLDNDPDVFMMLSAIGQDMTEDSTPQGAAARGQPDEKDDYGGRYDEKGEMMQRMRARKAAMRR